MNFLILINSAPDYQPFYLALGNELTKQGHRVIYAIESRLGNIEYPDNKIPDTPYVFSEYLRHQSNSIELPRGYKHFNIWETIFPDFDRFEHFNINLDKRHDWYSKVIICQFTFFELVLNKERIDMVLYENISNSFSYTAFLTAKVHGIPYLGWTSSRIPGRYEVHTSINSQRETIARTYQQLKEEQIILDNSTYEWCKNYLKNFMDVAPDYMAENGLLLQNPIRKYAKTKKLKRILHRFQFVLSNPSWAYPYHLGNPLLFSFKQFTRNFNRYIKSKLIQNHFTYPETNESFFLYPIHFHPESSTSISAKHYVDEAVVIKNISFNLPFGHFLYVKDHKSAIGYPSISFYKRISSLPNVRLIHPSASTKKLIINSVGVITLTSTVGYEAIVLRKPIIVLGDVFYDFHPLCYKVACWANLFPILLELLEHSFKEDIQDSISFIASYYLNTHAGKLIIGGNITDDLIIRLAKQAIQLAQKRRIENEE